MRSFKKICLLALTMAVLSGCAHGRIHREDAGLVAGGVAGGVIGHELGGTAGAIGGAVGGAYLGKELAR